VIISARQAGSLSASSSALFQGDMHVFVERIQPLRPVQRDDAIARAHIDENGTLVHPSILPLCATCCALTSSSVAAADRPVE
jgi:hypothetical protein